ncbi:hypothetical protein HJFPF1_00040 [Paramyrothecium foliicola]|nr:hypothetical protein HJFPF1_00040 [Paramyrothecium foliicola]
MRFAFPALLAATLLHQAQANFDVYRVELTWINRAAIVWQIWDSPPSCQHIWDNMVYFENKGDVSGKKLGVRCKGSGCHQEKPPQDIEELEMHFSNNPLYHWTIYKNRGRGMFGLNDKRYGVCPVKTGGSYNCQIVGVLQQLKGRRKFRCESNLSAPQIRKGFLNSKRSVDDEITAERLSGPQWEAKTLREWFLTEMDEATIEAAGGRNNLTMVPVEIHEEDRDEDMWNNKD